MLSVRPKVAQLSFQLYGRSLHPELFAVYKTRTIERNGYQARIQITSAGHVVTWQYDGITLTEVAASAQHPLPQRRRLLKHPLEGERKDEMTCRGGVKYRVNFGLETVDPMVFSTIQNELSHSRGNHGILHNFHASGRIAMGAVSFINVESRNRSLLIQAIHTFPDDFALVRSESCFELP